MPDTTVIMRGSRSGSFAAGRVGPKSTPVVLQGCKLSPNRRARSMILVRQASRIAGARRDPESASGANRRHFDAAVLFASMRQYNLQSFHQSLHRLRGNDLYASRPLSIAVIAKQHNRLFRTVDLYPITERCHIFPLHLWANN